MEKVAIVYFGIPRNSARSMPTIHENIYKPLKMAGYGYDIFHHLYLTEKIDNRRSKEHGQINSSNYNYFEGSVGLLEQQSKNLTAELFSKACVGGDYWHDGYASLQNLLYQLRSIKIAYHQIADSSKYSAIIFLRPDLLYLSPINISAVRNCSTNPSLAFVPYWQWFGGVNDRLSICGAQAASIYATRIEQVESYLKFFQPLHSERLLRFALERGDVSIAATNMKAARVRITGQVVQERFNALTTLGTIKNIPNLASALLLGVWMGALKC